MLYEVITAHDFKGVVACERLLVGDNVDVGVVGQERVLRGLDFATADVIGLVEDLALEI